MSGHSQLLFDNPGEIKNVESIKFSNKSVLKLPTASSSSNQVLMYNKYGDLEWKDINTIISKENSMLNVKMVWGFSDYALVFVVALLAIWFVKKASWKMFLTPVKKLFKFGEKKLHDAEEELKKAEQTWKDID